MTASGVGAGVDPGAGDPGTLGDAPLARELRRARAAGTRPFHMPGHKGGAGAPALGVELLGVAAYVADVSEVGGDFDYLHGPSGAMADAQAAAAALFGARRTWFLVNGATVGNLAALVALTAEGDEVLVARGSHRSVLGGLVLSGATPVYLPPALDAGLDGYFGVDVAGLRAALAEHPAVTAVHVTSPDYYGFVAGIADIAAACHRAGVPLVVDEAHGTHLGLDPGLPPSALAGGADLVVHSPHKTLGSLTQSAMLHAQGPLVDCERVADALALLQSSSPSSLLTVSLDVARAAVAGDGAARVTAAVDLARAARARVGAVAGLTLVDPSSPAGAVRAADPTKLVVDVTGLDLDGFAAADWLRRHGGVVAELADLRRVVCSITVADDAASVGALVDALAALAASAWPAAGGGSAAGGRARSGRGSVAGAWVAAPPDVVVTPREASRLPRVTVPVDQAAGRLAGEAVIPYPPGIPLVAPGERLDAGTLAALDRLRVAGCRIVGTADPTGATIACLDLPGAGPASAGG
ncbi:MAG TPA: aminotransferase class I/II-fold pyridoxal phosphate-dependent enzyme [Acidimicrobiales bacterium]|nr:aminotransferase class I/II-fold pyridoxal phosphate-dependent enzyme [Acidimicrobiales bacterium]